ncbi:nSTAND3 domain-containing NTPase [Pseudomonas sp. S3_C01]
MSVPKYDLHLLGWHSFQQLCMAVASTVLGQTVETFLEGNDGGRDGGFKGTWSPQPNELYEGTFVFQCKFTSRRDHNLTLSDVAGEREKVRRLAARGQCDVYVLMTNGDWTGESHLKIKQAFEDAGAKHVLLMGSTWICEKIQLNSNLRMNVPRLYGLGDLSQILDERRYKQTKALLTELPELSKLVVTGTYRKALQALQQHGFVLLVGEPAAGKTTIASLMAMCAMDKWGSRVLKLEKPQQIRDHWNTDEASQFIWIDDAFGAMQYEADLVMEWNRILPALSTMIRAGHRVVLTSRDYIYNSARRDLKRTAFPLIEESQVVIDVKDLTPREKSEILYNHVKLGNQPRRVRTALKEFLPAVAAHSRFAPETARRLGSIEFTRALKIDQRSIDEFVAKQERWLVETMQGMDDESQAALALLYMKHGAIESPVNLSKDEVKTIERLGGNQAGCIRALDSLRGSFVQVADTAEGRYWRYKHPTIGDAFALILAQSPDHLQIFVDGTPIERLMELVTCGDAGIQNATILPSSMFAVIATRCYQYVTCGPDVERMRRSRVYSFLLRRTDHVFLAMYSKTDGELASSLVRDFARNLFTMSSDLALRLLRKGLLPESARDAISTKIYDCVFDEDDLGYIYDQDMHEFFSDQEREDFYNNVQKHVLSDLDRIRQSQQETYNYEGDPDYHLSDFIDQLKGICTAFPDWPGVEDVVDTQRRRVDDWVDEVSQERGTQPAVGRNDLIRPSAQEGGRNIFDDVDL